MERFVRKRAPDVTRSELDACEAWLTEAPEHRESMSEVERVWDGLQGLERWADIELARLEVMRPTRRRPHVAQWLVGLGTACPVALVILAGYPMLSRDDFAHITTSKGEQRRVVLEDGSRLHLNSSSAVDVHFNRKEREVRLLAGEGLFDVAHDPARPFTVEVSGSKVVAVGTRFNVRLADDELAVTVLEGKVMILPDVPTASSRDESDVLLQPNQQARIDVSGTIEVIRTVDAPRLTSWDKGLLVFDNTPLRQVAKELSRYVAGEIRIAADVPDYPVTGTIKIRDKETMLRILSEVVPVTPVQTSPSVSTLVHSPPTGLPDDG